jgi:Transglycosylase SLT domain
MTRDLVSLLTMLLVIGYSWPAAHADTVTLLHQAAHRYEVPNSLLLAIAYVESKGVLTALNIDGTSVFPATWEEGQQLVDRHAQENLDVGLMQVNIPAWSRRLQLSAQTLYQPQVNLPVAAYVLRRCIDDSGGDLWKGVGCYHSPTSSTQRRYVRRVWFAYTTLRQRGTFGPTLVSTTDAEPDRPSSVIQVGMTTPPSRAMVPSGGRYTLPPLSQWRPPSAGLPSCAGQQPQHRRMTGKGGLTLVFFSPGQPWPELGETPRALVMGMCVECRLGELLPLSTALGHPVQVAAPALLAELRVTCLPTVIELTNASTLNEVQP